MEVRVLNWLAIFSLGLILSQAGLVFRSLILPSKSSFDRDQPLAAKVKCRKRFFSMMIQKSTAINLFFVSALVGGVVSTPAVSFADSKSQSSFSMDFFSGKFSNLNVFSKKKKVHTIQIPNEEVLEKAAAKKKQAEALRANSAKSRKLSDGEAPLKKASFEVISRDNPGELKAPNQRTSMRIEADAPAPVHGGMEALAMGDRKNAKAYARQYTQYMSDVMYYVREWSGLVAEVLHEEGKINDDDFYRAPDMLNHALAESRQEMGSLFKPSHKDAMRRVEADPKAEIEVFYFFSLDCRYCRTMAPDVERLYLATKNDKRVKMRALTLGQTPDVWLDSYKDYTGLTLPMFQGEEVARQLQVSFVPALVVMTKNTNKAFVKTGEQSFTHMYEFVRTAQGLPTEMPRSVARLSSKRIGKVEKGSARGMNGKKPVIQEISYREKGPRKVKKIKKNKDKLSRF